MNYWFKIYLEDNLYKRFMYISTFSTTFLVLFVKKPGKKWRFCINYQKPTSGNFLR